MTQLLKQKYWHELFEAGVFLKALNSAWEILAGIFLLTLARGALPHIVIFFGRTELLGGHGDIVFRLANAQLTHLLVVNTRIFVGIYLLFHGIMNAFLAYNLFQNRLWAYPFSITFVSLFLIYQIYRLTQTHSGILLAVSILDVCFIALTFHEYRYQKNKALHAAAH